jgi:hypothetical protein
MLSIGHEHQEHVSSSCRSGAALGHLLLSLASLHSASSFLSFSLLTEEQDSLMKHVRLVHLMRIALTEYST